MKKILIITLITFVSCNKKAITTYGDVSYNYHGKTVTGGNISPFTVEYSGAFWEGIQVNFGVGNFVANFSDDALIANDSVGIGITYTHLSRCYINTPLLNDQSADSSSIVFTSMPGGIASGTFYIRGHIAYPSGSKVIDSVTNGTFTNVPIHYTFN